MKKIGVQKVLFWGTVAAGAAAAFLMYRRGESLITIAQRTVSNPIGALVNELRGGPALS